LERGNGRAGMAIKPNSNVPIWVAIISGVSALGVAAISSRSGQPPSPSAAVASATAAAPSADPTFKSIHASESVADPTGGVLVKDAWIVRDQGRWFFKATSVARKQGCANLEEGAGPPIFVQFFNARGAPFGGAMQIVGAKTESVGTAVNIKTDLGGGRVKPGILENATRIVVTMPKQGKCGL